MQNQSVLHVQFAGVNNIGKTTHANLLAAYMRRLGMEVRVIKFPMYDLLPHGPTIYQYFRDPKFRDEYRAHYGVGQADQEISRMVVENHHHYETTLRQGLREGVSYVTEDGVLNSSAWTMAAGFPQTEVMEMHQELSPGDVTILLNEVNGRRYVDAAEKGHVNEESEERQRVARENLLLLADNPDFRCERVDFELGWSKDEVFARVLGAVLRRCELKSINTQGK